MSRDGVRQVQTGLKKNFDGIIPYHSPTISGLFWKQLTMCLFGFNVNLCNNNDSLDAAPRRNTDSGAKISGINLS